ncbi:hypothetical protein OD91_1433 [Lutibacter sp. Hel_I_33_5]|uniref:hypothetical protein n=1 Tax=Lutibacter sp. Hel_I_33_5 TaxID=1566289 RepID=UPI0011A772E2|nr:hypothetical protein [Lutibacter sp. Hel_I_33_5]TVZ56153.1 hypothetical protein OD91_1433 [Lutibacter sp. Hel_I_33_5]
MKNIFTALFFISFFYSSFANNFDCASSFMSFLPEKTEISINSIFIIEGYGYSQKTINSFQNRKIYLVNNKNKVELELLEILIGDMQLTQAIFKPKSELRPNSIYFLKYSDQTKQESQEMVKWNSKTGEREKVFWKTNNQKEINLLNSDLRINFKKTQLIHYGCGPSSNAIFSIHNKSNKEIWYKTELIDLTTNSKKVYIIKEWKNEINVGHGMCSGAFKFNNKGKYKVRFTPMNTDGKMNKKTKWYTFESPNSKNTFGF